MESPVSQPFAPCLHYHAATDGATRSPRSLHDELQAFARAVDLRGWKAGRRDFLRGAPGNSRWEFYQTISFNQAGWRFLLSPGPLERILCLDTSFGSTALGLSSMCGQLSVIQFDLQLLQVIQQRLREEGVANTDYTLISPSTVSLPFPDHHFDGFVLHDLELADPWQTAGQKMPAPAGLQKLFAEVRRVLKRDGFLYVGVRNRYSYTRWGRVLERKRSPTGMPAAKPWISWRQMRRLVRHVGLQTMQAYRLVLDNDRLVEIVLERRYRSVKNRFAHKEALKEFLLSEPLGAWVAPAYGLLAFKGKASPNFLDRLITDLQQRGMLPARIQDSYVAKRYLILPGKVILSVGRSRAAYGEKIVVLPLGSAVLARLRHEAAILQALARTGVQLAAMIPTFYGEGCVQQQQYFVQSELPGVSVDVDGPWLHEVTPRAAQVLGAFHAETAKRQRVENAVFTRLVSHPLQRVLDKLGPTTKGTVESIEAALRERLWGRWVPTVWAHGDYKIENVLINQHTRAIQGVIDWDLSQPEGLPLLDLLYLITYNRVICERRGIEDLFLDHILPKRFSPFEEFLYHTYIRDIGIDDAVIDALHIMFWIHHVAYRSSPSLEHVIQKMRAVTHAIAGQI